MDTLKVISPYDLSEIDEIPMLSSTQVEEIFATAHLAFSNREKWLTKQQRIKILENALILFQQRKQELVSIAIREGGKPYQDTVVEVERAIQGIQYASTCLQTQHGREIPMGISDNSAHRLAYTFHEPIGLVFAISAFNHPVNLIVHQVIPAIASGCPVIIKPASTTPLSCIAVIDILHAAGCPKEWCQMIICNNDIAEKYASDNRIRFLSFIGSAKVGWYLRSKLPPGAACALEHGGAAPVIVEEDADLEDALPLLVKGGFYHAGQVCVSVQRIYVWYKNAKSLAKSIAAAANNLKVGDPLKKDTDVGPLITPQEVDRVDQWVQEAIYDGAKLLCGGKKISETCYAPTVLYAPPKNLNVSQNEIFGPVVCVYPFKDREEAIAHANELPFIFQSAVFTKNINNALDMVKRLNANTVMVNDHTAFRVDWMPFGGRDESGLRLGGIPYSIEDLTHEKLMVIRSSSL